MKPAVPALGSGRHFPMEGDTVLQLILAAVLAFAAGAGGDVPTDACPMPAWWTAEHGPYTKQSAALGRHTAPRAQQRTRIIVDDGVPFLVPAGIIVDDGVPFERFDLDRRGR